MSSFSEPRPKSYFGPSKKIAVGLSGFALFLLLGALGWWMFPRPTSQNVGYAPVQPIPFSHLMHAGTLKIDCRYCHTGAYKSIHAGIPSMNVCLNCHSVVLADKSPFIKKLREAYSEGRPIEWVRVYELPDHARFDHKRHVLKGVKCETCHGNVSQMAVIRQETPLTMGWCLGCHRGQTTPKEVMQAIYPNQQNPQGPAAPFNCTTCHY